MVIPTNLLDFSSVTLWCPHCCSVTEHFPTYTEMEVGIRTRTFLSDFACGGCGLPNGLEARCVNYVATSKTRE